MVVLMESIRRYVQSWIEWQEPLAWAKIAHPNWAKLATQKSRPEIRETYRKKIIREYCDRYL